MFFTARTYDDILPVGDEIRAGLLHFTYLTPLAMPWLLGAALIGLVSLRRRLLYFAPEFAFFLLPLLVVVVFWYTPRYRFPAVPVVCVAAALIVVGAPSVMRKSVSVAALAAAITLGLLGEGVRQTIALDQPTGPHAHFSIKLAGSLAWQGRIDEAIETLEVESERSPENSQVRTLLGSLLARAGRRAEAIEANRRALELDPNNRAACTGLALLLIARNADGDLEAAIEHLRGCLGNSLYDPICYYGIGAALQKLDRLDEAVHAYEQALDARPDYEPARRALEALSG
jgi:Flp pilus assembly protein TadD